MGFQQNFVFKIFIITTVFKIKKTIFWYLLILTCSFYLCRLNSAFIK